MVKFMSGNDTWAIPNARVDDLDIEQDQGELEWERRVMLLSSERIGSARARLEQLGIIDAAGNLVSRTLPPDMDPASDTTLETG